MELTIFQKIEELRSFISQPDVLIYTHISLGSRESDTIPITVTKSEFLFRLHEIEYIPATTKITASIKNRVVVIKQ